MKFVIIHGQKIDINSFKHPGGQQVLEAMAGRDCTEEFTAIHSERAWKQVRCLGVKPALGTSPFLQLHQQLRDEGLFELNTEFYWREAARIASLFALFCVLLPVQPAASALALGIFWQQLSFVGHDVGHGAMPFLRPLLVCCLGISLNWWQSSHSVHHVLTNIQEHDPDVQHAPVFALSKESSEGYFSHYHRRHMTYLSRFLIRIQHLAFYPVMALARWNLYAQSLIHVYSNSCMSEAAWLCIFAAWLALATWLSGSPLLFLTIAHGTAGILHVQITLNHFTMPLQNTSVDFATQQLLTTANIDLPRWLDWFGGGLHLQIEHHLFPRLPRHNLRRITQRVRTLSERLKIPYRSFSFVEANRQCLNVLRQAS